MRPFVPVDPDRMELLANYLRRAASAEKFYSERDLIWEGEAGSKARAERSYRGPYPSQYSWVPRAISVAYAAARIGMAAVAEQAITLARIITDPTLGPHGVLGTEVCSRSAVEVGARAWRLMDGSIDAKARVARYFGDQLHSAHQAQLLCSKMGWTIETIQSPTVESLTRRCTDLGLSVTKLPRGEFEVDGERRPSATDLIVSFMGTTPYSGHREMIYRLQSATTHGTLYALMRSYVPIEESYEGEPMVGRMADHRVIEANVGVTLAAFIALLERVVALTGWSWYRAETFKNMTFRMLADGPG